MNTNDCKMRTNNHDNEKGQHEQQQNYTDERKFNRDETHTLKWGSV